jgi:hypothetical protein
VDEDYVYSLVRSVSMYSVKKMFKMVEVLMSRQIFCCCPEIRKKL